MASSGKEKLFPSLFLQPGIKSFAFLLHKVGEIPLCHLSVEAGQLKFDWLQLALPQVLTA